MRSSPLFFQPSLGAVSQRFGGDSRENLATKPDCVVKPLRNPPARPHVVGRVRSRIRSSVCAQD